jgi:hypothetical protein
MKHLAFLFLLLLALPARAQSLADEGLLWTDPTFQSRVHSAMLQYAVTISNEGTGVSNHASRDNIAIQVLEDTSGRWVQIFAAAVAAQPSIAAAADANGATPLVANVTTCTSATPPVCTTTGNLSTQAALVTDAAIIAAVSGGWNSLIGH